MQLTNQPPVEVIFGLHWKNGKNYPDPHYELVIGSFYERIKNEFPIYERLPTADIPEEKIPRGTKIVQYRFWSKDKVWPVVQLGPGVLTVNMNEKVKDWNTFKSLVENVFTAFFENYPRPEELVLESLILRCISMFPIDFSKINLLDFLKSSFNLPLNMSLLQTTKDFKLSETPVNINLGVEYNIAELNSVFGLRLFKMLAEEKDNLIMENYIISKVGLDKKDIIVWFDKAYNIIDLSFLTPTTNKLKEELR